MNPWPATRPSLSSRAPCGPMPSAIAHAPPGAVVLHPMPASSNIESTTSRSNASAFSIVATSSPFRHSRRPPRIVAKPSTLPAKFKVSFQHSSSPSPMPSARSLASIATHSSKSAQAWTSRCLALTWFSFSSLSLRKFAKFSSSLKQPSSTELSSTSH